MIYIVQAGIAYYLNGEFDGSSKDLCLSSGGCSADRNLGLMSIKSLGGSPNLLSLEVH